MNRLLLLEANPLAEAIMSQNDDTLALENPVRFIYKYLNHKTIAHAMKLNPNIKNILSEYNLPYTYNLKNAVDCVISHLVPTARIASKLYKKLGFDENSEQYMILVKAALLHDIGKVFIPSFIIEKTSKLNPKERQIIELHNKFSYEILKTTDLGQHVARLAYEHHNYEKKLKRTPENQILMIADIYSALKEKRPYRRALEDWQAKTILFDMGAKGCFDIGYLKYLFS